jgi:hypothetical protein
MSIHAGMDIDREPLVKVIASNCLISASAFSMMIFRASKSVLPASAFRKSLLCRSPAVWAIFLTSVARRVILSLHSDISFDTHALAPNDQ